MDVAHRVIGHLSQHRAKVELRIDPIELRRTDEAVHGGGTFSAPVAEEAGPHKEGLPVTFDVGTFDGRAPQFAAFIASSEALSQNTQNSRPKP